jgi:DNA-binding GntR family transcriptional regulator
VPAAPDLRPRARIAAELRARIIHAIITPGTMLDTDEIAGIAGPAFPPRAAVQALSDLKAEGLVTRQRYRWYATPTGPPDPAAGARLGTTLATLRRAAGRTPEDLSAGRHWDGSIREAEDGAWQPREFWAAMDARLGAGGTTPAEDPGHSS